MPGTSGAKTRFALLPGHDELFEGAILSTAFLDTQNSLR
jgi:hypothetical protein